VSNPPAGSAPGTHFTVTDTVKNQGVVAAGASMTRYYLSADAQKGAGDTLLTGSRSVPGLAAGASSAGGAVTVTIPSAAPLGTYFLLACADDLAVVVEGNEANNCLASATTVLVTRPDLVVTALSNPPGSIAPGGHFTVTDTVRNQGAVGAAASTTRYYLSADVQKSAGDTLLTGSRAVPALAAGTTSAGGAVTVTIPSTMPLGTYALLACADDMAVVAESDETNNCRVSATMVQVARPDLVVTAVSNPPATAVAGTNFTVTDSVLNQGGLASGVSTTRYYLSVDTMKAAGDTLLTGSRAVPALAAGGASAGAAITVTIPSATPANTYFLLACADDTAVVAEGVETNNCRAAVSRVIVSR